MEFGHEQLDVYRVSIRYVAWAYEIAVSLKGVDRHARDQLLRASHSIPPNTAEGNGNCRGLGQDPIGGPRSFLPDCEWFSARVRGGDRHLNSVWRY